MGREPFCRRHPVLEHQDSREEEREEDQEEAEVVRRERKKPSGSSMKGSSVKENGKAQHRCPQTKEEDQRQFRHRQIKEKKRGPRPDDGSTSPKEG